MNQVILQHIADINNQNVHWEKWGFDYKNKRLSSGFKLWLIPIWGVLFDHFETLGQKALPVILAFITLGIHPVASMKQWTSGVTKFVSSLFVAKLFKYVYYTS